MSARSNNAGGAKPLPPLDLCASSQSHICYMTLPPHCFIGQQPIAGDTTGEMPKLDASFTYLETKTADVINGGYCVLHRGLEGSCTPACLMRAFTSTFLPQPTQSSASFVSANLPLWSKTVPGEFMQWQKAANLSVPLPDSAWWPRVHILLGLLANLLTLV